MALYNIVVLGDGVPDARAALISSLEAAFDRLGLDRADISFRSAADVPQLSPIRPLVGVFIGPSSDPADKAAASQLDARNAPIIPAVADLNNFALDTPAVLHRYNGLAVGADLSGIPALTSAVLEWLGLLRRQRRLFLSYRRADSRDAALRLHDALQSAGFDVFLDTHEVRPGEDFQGVLMHRLTDCEVVVLFDTPGFLASRWTSEELARANLLGIGVLQIVWPNWTAPRHSPVTWPYQLEKGDLLGTTGPMTDSVTTKIIKQIEDLRSTALAFRTAAIAGEFTVQASRLGAIVTPRPDRTLKAEWTDGRSVVALPTIGIPAADRYHDAFEAAEIQGLPPPVLVYDETGVLERWVRHLGWLDQHLPIRALKITDISRRLGSLSNAATR